MLSKEAEDGFALPLAVGVLGVLALMCSLLFLEARGFKRSVTTSLLLVRARNTADGAIYETIFNLVSSSEPLGAVFDGSPFDVKVGDTRVVVRVTSESAKIDINLAPQNLLAALFHSVGASDMQSSLLAQRAVAWRRRDGESDAAEGAIYSAAGIGYSPRFAPFIITGELNFLPGMSTELAGKIENSVTVLSKDGFVDRTLASAPVLQALADSGDSLAAAELTARRGDSAAAARRHAAPGEAFTIDASVSTDTIAVKRHALVALRWDQGRPYDVLSLR